MLNIFIDIFRVQINYASDFQTRSYRILKFHSCAFRNHLREGETAEEEAEPCFNPSSLPLSISYFEILCKIVFIKSLLIQEGTKENTGIRSLTI